MGFLKKKGSKRWFLLLDNWLYWFPKVRRGCQRLQHIAFTNSQELPVGADTQQWDFLDKANGSVYLSRCVLSTWWPVGADL